MQQQQPYQAQPSYEQPQQQMYSQPGQQAQADLNPHSLYVQQLFSEQSGRGAAKSAPGHMGQEQPSQEKLADIKVGLTCTAGQTHPNPPPPPPPPRPLEHPLNGIGFAIYS